MSIKNKKEIPLYKKIHNWRVFPRLFSLVYLYLMLRTLRWVILIGNDISSQAAGFAGVIVSVGAAWFKFYVESGPGTKKGSKL